jgi:hypothetical protein
VDHCCAEQHAQKPRPGRVESWRGSPWESPWPPRGFPPSCPSGKSRSTVSSSRHIARSMRIYRTTRSCIASRQGLPKRRPAPLEPPVEFNLG